MYDLVIVGAGLFGSTFAHEVHKKGKKVLVIDKNEHIGGNVYTKNISNIPAHFYGPHLLHSNSKKIWDYINQFAEFNNYQHKVKSISGDKIFSLPFNMNTFQQLWGCVRPNDAKRIIESQKIKIENPSNFEEQALSMVGTDIYHKLVYGYTKKQWGRNPKELPASIIKRIPIRFEYNDNYFNDSYQGIPINGYTEIIENMLKGIEVRLGVDFFKEKIKADKIVYSGSIDELFNYKHGVLEYRSLRFDHKVLPTSNFQGIGQMNYADEAVSFTRIVEPKHFHGTKSEKTLITYEYPMEWSQGKPRYYPINDEKNNNLYKLYLSEFKRTGMIGGGRLFEYKYMDMDAVVASALVKSNTI